MADAPAAISAAQIAAELADENPSPLLRVAADGILLFANSSCRELLSSWNVHPGLPVPDHVREHVQTALKTGRLLEWDESCGEQSLLFVVVPFVEKSYAGIFGRDIQKRKQVESQLRIVAEQLRSFFELSPDLMAVAGFDGWFKQLSPSWQRALGHSAEELTAHPWLHFIHPDDREKTVAAGKRVMAGEPLSLFENRYRCKDGSYRWIEWHCIAAPEQQLIYCVARDVTERKQADEAQQRANLKVLVQQRTRELEAANARLQIEIAERQRAQETLQQTAEELRRSNLDLEQFAYVASHDLQEPLRAVGGYVKLLQRRFPDKVDPKALEFIAGAADGAARMEQLITDLLDFARVGTRGGAFHPASLDALLDNALRNLQSSITAAGARVTHDHLPSLPVDATQIMQVFQNLVANAIKFRSELPPQIHISAESQPRRWVFSVRDNGIGIHPQYFQRIFQIFQRLHTRKQYPGTGIGLAICKRIVERHGGSIWVQSQPGQGSTFYFSIPTPSSIR